MPKILIMYDCDADQLDEILSILGEASASSGTGEVPSREEIEASVEEVSSGLRLEEFPKEVMDSLQHEIGRERPTATFKMVERAMPKDALVQAAKGDPLLERAVAVVYSQVSPNDYPLEQLQKLVERTAQILASEPSQKA